MHTWPESGFAAFDFLTCGTLDLEALNDHLKWELEHYHQKLLQEQSETDSEEGEKIPIRYDWSLLRRGERPQSQHRVKNDGQALRHDM